MSMHIVFCREYAVAKECITEKAKANCEICEQLSRDTYNPFCPNNTDPLLYTNGMSNPLLRVSICMSVYLDLLSVCMFVSLLSVCLDILSICLSVIKLYHLFLLVNILY